MVYRILIGDIAIALDLLGVSAVEMNNHDIYIYIYIP